MNFINGYGSSGSDSDGGNGNGSGVVAQASSSTVSCMPRTTMTVNAAPSVCATGQPQMYLPDGVKTLKTNPRIDTLWSVSSHMQGKQQQPNGADGGIGKVDVSYVDAAAFEQQFYSHEQRGYSFDPSGTGAMVGNYRRVQQMQQQQNTQAIQPRKRKRGQGHMDLIASIGDADGLSGPWAPVAAVAKAEERLTEEQQKVTFEV